MQFINQFPFVSFLVTFIVDCVKRGNGNVTKIIHSNKNNIQTKYLSSISNSYSTLKDISVN